MRRIAPFASWIALCVVVLTPAPAAAHSLAELQAMLGGQEKNFQPIDKDAPQFVLQDVEGHLVALADFRGKVVVLHFIYTNCSDVYRLQLDRLVEIQSMVNQSPMKDQVQFITITTNPATDAGSAVTEYGRAHGLDPVNWVFLTTKPDQPEDATRKLAAQFGHPFEKTDDECQVDGVLTHVIDKEDRWRANFHGLKFEPTNLVVFVNALVNDIARPHEEPNVSFWQKLKSWF